MKKTMKKVLTMVLAMCMVLAMSVTVFADTSVDVSKHTFEAYQIFSGTQATDGGALGNVEWGTGVNSSALLAALKEDTTLGTDFANCITAADVANVVTGYESNSDKAEAFARLVDANKTSTTTAITENKISTPGYYLIVDTTDVAGKQDAKNLSLLAVSNTVTIASKTSVPTVVKKVDDKNDSNTSEDNTTWQDSADYDIGDSIPYQITATMGDLSAYKTYYVEFTDTMTHLTYVDKSVKVTIDGTDKTDAFTTSWNNDTKILTVKCADVIAQGAKTDSKIVVTYNATLDSDATIGSTGNPNTVYMEYSNNPNNSGNGTDKPETGKTPEDKNIVFTYKVDANKITADKAALAGAAFELQKQAADGTWSVVGIQNATKGEDGKYTITDATQTSFEWKGIDDGTYKIVEVITPAGYNTIADQVFTVAATHETEADEPKLQSLSGTAADGSVITLTADMTAGSLTTDIVNQAGATLPTTGGMGTTLFYVLGTILVLGAGVVLVARRRMAR